MSELELTFGGNLEMDEKYHGQFQSRLTSSEKAKRRVGKMFHEAGFPVRMARLSVSRTSADRRQHSDNGDLFVKCSVRDSSHPLVQRVEVKQRPKIYFTCAGDITYPDLIVMDCAPFMLGREFRRDKSTGRFVLPIGHVFILDASFCHYAYVNVAGTFDSWTSRPCPDHARPEIPPTMKYFIKPSDCVFGAIADGPPVWFMERKPEGDQPEWGYDEEFGF